HCDLDSFPTRRSSDLYFSVKRRKQLTERMNQFIAPWIYSNHLPLFGFFVNLEKMYNALLIEFGSLISISDFSAIRIEKENNNFRSEEHTSELQSRENL